MMRIIAPLISVIAIAGIAVGNTRPTVASVPADTLYGSALVELGDPGERSIVTIDQNDGSITWLEPQSENFKGLAFDSDGRLFATDCDPYGFGTRCILVSEPTSLLMELDPVTGAILNTIGTVTDAFGFRPTIETLSVQPGTDILYGFGGFWGSRDVEMWMIDKSTAIATLVASFGPCISSGSTPSLRGCGLGYGFAPDGTLYHLASDHSGRVGWLITLDPSTGALITSTPLDHPTGGLFGAALAVRSDGTVFSSRFYLIRTPLPCAWCPPLPPTIITLPLLTIDPQTGAVTEVGTAEGAVAYDLDFSRVVVESVDIAIKPGSDPGVVNPLSRGVMPVAIFGSGDFDVADIDVTSLTFGFGDALPASVSRRNRDVDADGFPDLLLHFRIAETGVEIGDTEACLRGETLDGTPFSGCDTIRTVPDR